MLFLTRWFGVTGSDAERSSAREKVEIDEIIERSLLMQSNAAAKQKRALGRGTHVKGVSVRAQFEVFDVTVGRDRELAARLAKGMFAKPSIYPAIVRFGNADPNKNSDFNPDVRLWSLPFKDKLRLLRTLTLVQFQLHQKIKPYQQLRYESNVPFRYGPVDVVKHSATPSPDNPASPLQRRNPNGLQDELIRHIQEDSKMSSFDFGVQFLDVDRMTYWGKHRDTNFWIENASVLWKEAEAPFHTVAR